MVSSSHTMTRTVVVLGASYAGHRAITVLAQHLPPHWRIVVLERNTHANHLYIFPRMCLLEGHEHKVFIPYTNIFSKSPAKPDAEADQDTSRHSLLHATVTRISTQPRFVEYVLMDDNRAGDNFSQGPSQTQQLRYDYLVYALGSHLPPPINIWSGDGSTSIYSSTSRSHPQHPACTHTASPRPPTATLASKFEAQLQVSPPKAPVHLPPTRGTKVEGMAWLQETQRRIKSAHNVLVIGGGALGVQFASDIADMYGSAKTVTLLHSGPRLLPRFEAYMHDETMRRLSELGVNVMLMSRVDLASISAGVMEDVEHEGGVKSVRVVRTVDGRRVHADLVLFCTGQKPNTSLLAEVSPASVDAWSNLALVNRNLQLAVPPVPASTSGSSQSSDNIDSDDESSLPLASDRIFVIGDSADAFGALKAGHTAWGQAEVAARNICRLIARNARDTIEQRKRAKAQAQAQANGRLAAAKESHLRFLSVASSDEETDNTSSTGASLFEAHLTNSSISSASSSGSLGKNDGGSSTSYNRGVAPLPLPVRLQTEAPCDSSTTSYKPCGDACTCSSAPPTRPHSPHPTSVTHASPLGASSDAAATPSTYDTSFTSVSDLRRPRPTAAPCDSAERGYRPCGDACTCGAMSTTTSAAPTRPSSRSEVRANLVEADTPTQASTTSECDSALGTFRPCGDACTCDSGAEDSSEGVVVAVHATPPPPPVIAAVPLGGRLGARKGTTGAKLWTVRSADEVAEGVAPSQNKSESAVKAEAELEDDSFATEDLQCAELIQTRLGTLDLERYNPPPHSIKVSLGLSYAIAQSAGKFSVKPESECPLDLNAPSMWKRRGLATDNLFL